MKAEPFSFSIEADAIPAKGRHFHLEADEEARLRLAQALGLLSVTAVVADLDVKPLPQGVMSVRGEVRATVVQTDVVTLEPISQEIAEEVDVTLRPAERASSGGRNEDDPESSEDGDRYFDNRIDLGALVGEHLALGLDTYPRAPGVEFEPHVEDSPAADQSAFAALAALKDKRPQ